MSLPYETFSICFLTTTWSPRCEKEKKSCESKLLPIPFMEVVDGQKKLEHVYLPGCLVGENSFQIFNMTIEKLL